MTQSLRAKVVRLIVPLPFKFLYLDDVAMGWIIYVLFMAWFFFFEFLLQMMSNFYMPTCFLCFHNFPFLVSVILEVHLHFQNTYFFLSCSFLEHSDILFQNINFIICAFKFYLIEVASCYYSFCLKILSFKVIITF